VAWVREHFALSTSRACRATGQHRSPITRRLRRPEEDRPVRQRLRELAGTRLSYGYPRLHVLLRREGWVVNRGRVYRLCREEGLTLKRRRPTRRKSAVQRDGRPAVTAAKERWAMDFMHDTLSGGRTIRVLTLVDVYTREWRPRRRSGARTS
jgi:putative transposase